MVPRGTMGNHSDINRNERPNCILSITSKVPPTRLDTRRDPALRRLPRQCQKQTVLLRLVGTELPEHQSTMRGLKELHLAQNRDLFPLALKKLINNEPFDDILFPENMQDFGKRYSYQKRTYCF